MVVHAFIFFVIGAALGSFSLVLAWRMHDKKDWVRGRSACEACGHVLSARDMIPIVSWLALRGKCRYCSKPFSKQLLFAELLLGTILAVSWLFWPFSVDSFQGYGLFFIWILVSVLLSALFWYDLRWYLLPNKLIYTLLPLSIIYAVIRGFVVDYSFSNIVVMPVLSVVFLSGLFFLLYTVSRGKWIGFGDVRLGYSLGLLIGTPTLSWLMLFMASVLGIIVALPSLLKGNRKLTSKIPFGPLLIVATILVVLFGQKLVDWYMNILGL
jgi:prepilin signal peptidase PulO-like enzyme (type II secretory pathway)